MSRRRQLLVLKTKVWIFSLRFGVFTVGEVLGTPDEDW